MIKPRRSAIADSVEAILYRQLAFYAPLTTSVVPSRGVGSATFTRATTATVQDWEGSVYNVLSGEVRFQGARRVKNNVTGSSENFGHANWLLSTASKTGAATVDGVACWEIAFTASASAALYQTATLSTATDARYAMRAYVRAKTGTVTLRLGYGAVIPGDHSADISIGTTWTRIGGTSGALSNGTNFSIRNGSAGAACDFYVAYVQHEDVTGQSNQNPSEYVSVGVLASPFHGAMVDGVKYFDTENGNTVASNVVTEATGAAIGEAKNQSGRIPSFSNSAGDYFKTGSGLAAIGGSFDVDVCLAPDDWTPAGSSFVIARDHSSNRCFGLAINPTAGLYLELYDTAGGVPGGGVINSTAAISASDFTRLWVRAKVTWVLEGSILIDFYTSQDGLTWTALGTQVSRAATGNAPGSTTNLFTVGARQFTGNEASCKGTYSRARVYQGHRDAGGTLLVDFNPDDYTSGASFTSSATPAVTWTLNGGAAIRNFPLLGYLSELASTNLVLQSENFGTTWTANGTPTRSAAALRCGGVVLDLIGDDDAGVQEAYLQPITFTGNAVKAVSFFIAQGTATTTILQLRDTTAVATRLDVAVTWSGGVPQIAMTTGTHLGTDTLGNGVFRVRLATTAVTAANTNRFELYMAGSAAANTGNVYIGGVQAENNTVCTSYIPTTTATVTRNTDALAYTTAGNLSGIAGTATVELTGNSSGNAWIIGDGSAAFYVTSNALTLFDGTANRAGNAITLSATPQKVGALWSGTSSKTALTGTLSAALGFDGDMGWAATFGVGSANTGGSNINGTIRNVKLWTRPLSDIELIGITR